MIREVIAIAVLLPCTLCANTNEIPTAIDSFAPVAPLPKGLSLLGIEKLTHHFAVLDTWTKDDIGKDAEGFRLLAFDEKHEMREVDGKKQKVDVSLLTIRFGKRTIRLRRSPKHRAEAYIAHLHLEPEDVNYMVRVGDTFLIRKEEFTLIRIEPTNKTTVLVRIKAGEELRLGYTEKKSNKVLDATSL